MATPRHYTAEDLLVRPQQYPHDPGLVLEVTPESAGWDYISFQVRRLQQGESWSFGSGENELALVDLTGSFAVKSNRGEWPKIGGRTSVFEGAAHALYLPRRSSFTVTALDDCEFAVTWTPTDQDRAAFLRTPHEVPISVRGGDNVSRQINDLLPPGSPVHRLVLVEVYTPSGNWSSYPPHKHDVHIAGPGRHADRVGPGRGLLLQDRPPGRVCLSARLYGRALAAAAGRVSDRCPGAGRERHGRADS